MKCEGKENILSQKKYVAENRRECKRNAEKESREGEVGNEILKHNLHPPEKMCSLVIIYSNRS